MDAQELARVAKVRDFIKNGGARAFRIEHGLKGTELAEAAGLSAVNLWRYENGQRTPTAKHALALADVYAVLGWEE